MTTGPLPDLDLMEYLSAARWYAGKGRSGRLTDRRRLGWLTPTDADPAVAVELAEVTYDDGEVDVYQVPLAYYREPQDRLGHAFVGVIDADGDTDSDDGRGPDGPPTAALGSRHVYDALHDRLAMNAYLQAFGAAADSGTVLIDGLEFDRLPGHELDLESHSSLFSGEQSNSTAMFGEDAVLKVFRRLSPGVNPDIEIHRVLTEFGSTHVAQLYGWIQTQVDGEVLQLGLLQQFLRTAADGWDLALVSVRNLFSEADLHAEEVGGDFASEAARLGIALAEVHEVMRTHVEPIGQTVSLTEVAAAMTERLRAAVLIVPGLAEMSAQLQEIFDRIAALGEHPAQRVHGDLHLGQTMRTVLGWKLVDFEGEPAKPLAERIRPDIAWRDVAGMMRSFDYAARSSLLSAANPDDERFNQLAYRSREWARRNQKAFLEAYAGEAISAEEMTVLRAYIADKAIYEAIYETRNRPTWVAIPMAAIATLVTDETRLWAEGQEN